MDGLKRERYESANSRNNMKEIIAALLEKDENINTKFQPVFIRLNDKEGKSKLQEILKQPGIRVTDTLFSQLSDLIKYRTPSRKFSKEELEISVLQLLKGNSLEAYGVWVFYPWSNRLVHILDEEEFIEVRTSRNQYKITAQEQKTLRHKKIGVIGLSVGQSVSVTLAMERVCGELRLADFDSLELTNLNRIRTGIHNLGLPKVFSVAREIAEIDPFLKVVCFPEGIHDENIDSFFCDGGPLDLLIEEADGFDIKILSRYKARELKIPVLMEASDRCMVDVERFDLEPNRSILHGLVDHLDVATLKKLKTTEEKIPYMLDVLGIETASARLKASMLEIEQSINTWPQLASAVTMGGGISADVARRLLLGLFSESGRYFIDVEELIGNQTKTLSQKNEKQVLEKVQSHFPETKKQEEFPKNLIDELINAAKAAPSFGNSQPWYWQYKNGYIYLSIEPSRLIKLGDESLKNVFTSIGTSLKNFELVAAKNGYKTRVEYFPLDTNKHLVASIELRKESSQIDPQLIEFILKRNTNRGFAKPIAVSEKVCLELELNFENQNNFKLDFIQDIDTRTQIAELYGAAERLRMLDLELNQEYFEQELHTQKGKQEKTGYQLNQLQAPIALQYATSVLKDKKVVQFLTDWNKGQSFQNYHSKIVASSPVIGVISAKNSNPESLVQLGELVQQLWLNASVLGLSFHPICLPIYLLSGIEKNLKNNKHSNGNIFCEYHTFIHLANTTFTRISKSEVVFMFRLFYGDDSMVKTNRLEMNNVFKIIS